MGRPPAKPRVALIVLGLSAPAIGYARAPLYWDETELFGEAFWTVVGLGAAVGLPLIAIGLFALLRARRAAPRPDPWWFLPLRWALQAGLLLIVVALRAGNWDDGIPLVYAGAGLALVAMLIARPRRIAVTRRGIGLLLLFLGAGALVVVGVASASGGGNISEDEAMVGIIPAAIVAGLGLLLALTARRRQGRPTASAAPAAEEVSTDGLDSTVLDLLNADAR